MKKNSITLLTALALTTSVLGQTPGPNQAAVDTLTKDVALAVFANQKGDKASEIVDQLSTCGGGCDVVSIIRGVGGWDAVGVKMQELGRLKSTAPFQTMSPSEANAAIRREFTQFYAKYKADKNYGQPLSADVQTQIFAKIDRMLPPAPADQPAAPVAGQPASGETEQVAGSSEDVNIDGAAIRMSQLERAVNEEKENRIWMIILSGIAGLLVGAGVVYFLMYRALKQEVDRLIQDNRQLSRDLDFARRPKPANEPRHPQADNRKQPDTYRSPQPPTPAVAAATIESTPPPVAPVNIRSGTPSAGVPNSTEPVPIVPVEPASVPTQSQVQPIAPVAASVRNEVFYFPPPDPNGQFDNAHQAETLSPESAYRFSTTAPDSATFRFEAEPGRVARFLTYRNYMIEPACDSENSYSSQFTRIVNRRDGEAVLENGAWRVKTKALIRYE
ncbi:hypothetical protein [Spirosoma utsteinense]|uniref:Uncharacterized protein n=1 Tax=Spirosoma utsteinense TaxID=2585773 RepID=A0ABR6W7Q9_9BACT|nr:hypothetical protein [Spirosoma utsteinense]MBC3783985.1 hypothetical protein [Spirosoma utsteinense]MBC3792621.1 hypothetical protein [Spirosoma utsteinense]